jgi:Porin PorA
MRKTAAACGLFGLILLIAAGLMAWWITPSYIARVPGDYNKTRTYAGTLHTLFDPAALASGNLAAALKTNVPATLTDHVRVQQTSGNTALVQDNRTITAGGSTVFSTTSHYAVDRTSLEATSSHPGDWKVNPATGLTVSWPLGAQQRSYTGWSYLTQTTTPLRYVTKAQQGGLTTYQYEATIPPTIIKNSQVLSRLPRSLPASLVSRIAAAGIIPASDAASLAKAFPHATTIPLDYLYSAHNTYFVAPPSGLVVNVSNNETETAAIRLPTGKVIPLIPVLSDSYHATPSSLSSAVTDANNGSTAITTWGVTVPIVAAAVGFLLVVLAVLLWIFGRSRGRPVERREDQLHPSPAGRVG